VPAMIHIKDHATTVTPFQRRSFDARFQLVFEIILSCGLVNLLFFRTCS